ncbi:MAG: hypothetical protein IKE23_02520 [Exiguobacterium sp.]|nr:hypothetical protein [Exiguobacterium sp.]
MLTNGLKLVEAMEKSGYDLTSRSPRIQTIENTKGLWQLRDVGKGCVWASKGMSGHHVWTYRGDASFSYPVMSLKGPFLVPWDSLPAKPVPEGVSEDFVRKTQIEKWMLKPQDFDKCPDHINGEWGVTKDKKVLGDFWRKWVEIPRALYRDLGPYLREHSWIKRHLEDCSEYPVGTQESEARHCLRDFVIEMLKSIGCDDFNLSFEEVWDFLTNPEGKTIRCVHDYETDGVICSHSADEDFNQALVAFEKDHHRFPQMKDNEDPPVDTCALTGEKGHILRDKKGTSVVLPVVGRVTLFSNNPDIPCQQRYGKTGSGIVPVNEEVVNKIGMALVKITESSLYGQTWCRLRLGDRTESGGRKDDLLIAFYNRSHWGHILGPVGSFKKIPIRFVTSEGLPNGVVDSSLTPKRSSNCLMID